MSKLDWTKPIQFANGDKCTLVDTNLAGYTNWGKSPDGRYPTRVIQRHVVDESTTGGVMSALWHVYEDGRAPALLPGHQIINAPEPIEI
jgi:hypothetical protein